MNGTQPEGSRMARLAGTVLRLVSRDHVEQLVRWRTGAVENRSGGDHRNDYGG